MDQNVMNRLTYGLFVLSARRGEKDNGCIINTVTQITSEPNRISIAVNKSNYTHEMLMDTDDFTVSVLSENAEFSLFQHFGFQSGKDVDKFSDYSDAKRVANGTMAVTKGVSAYISARVTHRMDLGTHTLFLADVTDGEVLSSAPSVTYAYYHEHIKAKPKEVGTTEDGKTVWRCTICGYEYVGEELPEDFICPICKHPASDFEKVSPGVAAASQKEEAKTTRPGMVKYRCLICGEEFEVPEGQEPECPICEAMGAGLERIG